jgi:hypothetical protein
MFGGKFRGPVVRAAPHVLPGIRVLVRAPGSLADNGGPDRYGMERETRGLLIRTIRQGRSDRPQLVEDVKKPGPPKGAGLG